MAPEIPIDVWATRALELGVAIAGARQFTFDDRPIQSTRLGFTLHSEAELEEAARRMASALRSVRGKAKGR